MTMPNGPLELRTTYAETSRYNRQHRLRTDEGGEKYDPLVRDNAKYRALFYDAQSISTDSVRELPLSVGILQSFAGMVLGDNHSQTR